MIMCSVLISYRVCRRPSWKPKTQPNGSLLSFCWVFGFQLGLLEKYLITLAVFTFNYDTKLPRPIIISILIFKTLRPNCTILNQHKLLPSYFVQYTNLRHAGISTFLSISFTTNLCKCALIYYVISRHFCKVGGFFKNNLTITFQFWGREM